MIMHRRRMLGLLAGGATMLGARAALGADASCLILPEETNGPYPADGSNTANGSLANVLIDSGLVRSDITKSFGDYSGTAEGVPFELEITLQDASNNCAPLPGYVIYVWHCTADGEYSVYTRTDENYLRGAQVADENGKVTFKTIYPGAYRGRLPHIHFEIYPSLEKATSYDNRVLCSQIAFPHDLCANVYNSVDLYADSIAPFEEMTLENDNVFGDNTDEELAAQTPDITGSIEDGFKGTLNIAMDPNKEPVLNDAPPPLPDGMSPPDMNAANKS